jgi:glyoxalase superfamily protein
VESAAFPVCPVRACPSTRVGIVSTSKYSRWILADRPGARRRGSVRPSQDDGLMSIAALTCAVLNCADPKALAAFYLRVIDAEVLFEDDTYSFIGHRNQVNIAFQRVENYAPPPWPDGGTQAHLDFRVPDVAAAEVELLALGAIKPEFQPGEDTWTVLIDPAGHPFCITAAW